ncbi:MAG: TlpA family protein disulfide reductase [Gammaproteobacteria bacterium]|nr:TlpA family protein disulfide reductase [Gammaproteobacteria bacterium]
MEVTLETYPADGRHLLLWTAPGYGFREGHREMAARLAARGMEIWQADLNEALFLARGSPAMRRLDGRYVADLVERAHAATGKRIALMSGSYGAIPVLRGARQWQLRGPEKPYLIGAVLFSPNVYTTIPSLGLEPEYLPIARATNIPVMVFQGGTNANRWQVPKLLAALRSGGSPAYVQILPGIVDLFYEPQRPQAVQAQLAQLPRRLERVLPLLEKAGTPLQAVPMQAPVIGEGRGLDAELKPFRGDPRPPAIRLPDARGRLHEVEGYRGRVTVVNFWATWCPPCVAEIPSLNRLRRAMADEPFVLISINYAEPAEVIRAFMDEVEVDYPVLIDEDGRVAARWGVLVFPSTFVIGPGGAIRYGVNAAIRWDAPPVIAALRRLAEKAP